MQKVIRRKALAGYPMSHPRPSTKPSTRVTREARALPVRFARAPLQASPCGRAPQAQQQPGRTRIPSDTTMTRGNQRDRDRERAAKRKGDAPAKDKDGLTALQRKERCGSLTVSAGCCVHQQQYRDPALGVGRIQCKCSRCASGGVINGSNCRTNQWCGAPNVRGTVLRTVSGITCVVAQRMCTLRWISRKKRRVR